MLSSRLRPAAPRRSSHSSRPSDPQPRPSRRAPAPGRAALVAGTAAAALFLAGCSGTASADSSGAPAADAAAGSSAVAVVASTNVWGDIVKQLGGDAVNVTSIIDDPSKDPHDYEADTQNQLTLSKAKIVIENGGGYDDFVDTMLKSANSPATVINAVDISGLKPAAGGELNEHIWYNYPVVEKVAEKIAAQLEQDAPAAKDSIESNLGTFKANIAKLTGTEADLKAKYAGQGVAITEPVPLYALQAVGLVNKTPAEFSEAVEEGNDVPPAALSQALALFTGKQVKALFYNEQATDAAAEQVKKAAQDNKIAVVGVTETLPSGKDYFSWQTDNLKNLEEALAG